MGSQRESAIQLQYVAARETRPTQRAVASSPSPQSESLSLSSRRGTSVKSEEMELLSRVILVLCHPAPLCPLEEGYSTGTLARAVLRLYFFSPTRGPV
ncbi:hypothetical protein Y1Q_0003146 [Alligator mississippiensis]|uniref:Uncharacterized protein n=1 Tax=Alligator mississippiensis TaxID=8496 RepID=A0A151MDL8_ALLMI|nr:hypothetical protein Y1Q_0003146 [Alligator mississippiensis]